MELDHQIYNSKYSTKYKSTCVCTKNPAVVYYFNNIQKKVKVCICSLNNSLNLLEHLTESNNMFCMLC